MNTHIKRVKKFIPGAGQVCILSVTDKQYSEIHNFWGKIEKAKPSTPQQLELF